MGRFLIALAYLAFFALRLASAMPPGVSSHYGAQLDGVNTTDLFADFPRVIKSRQNKDIELRILPLGASIMSGLGASDEAG